MMVSKEFQKVTGSLSVILCGLFRHRHRFETLVVKERGGNEYDYRCKCGKKQLGEDEWLISDMPFPPQVP